MSTSISLSMITALLSIWSERQIDEYATLGITSNMAVVRGNAAAVSGLFLLMAVSLACMVLLVLLSKKEA